MAISPITEFALLARMPDAVLDLEALSIAIARMGNASIDATQIHAQLNAMAEEVSEDIDPQAAPDRLAAMLRYAFHERLGLGGGQTDWKDPTNSFIDVVLSRRAGLPILLSVIWILLGKRLNIPIKGISWPGQFLVCLDMPGTRIYMDPYNNGQRREAADMLAEAGPGSRPFLNPVQTRAIGLRMLSNLKHLWIEQEDWPHVLAVIDRILLWSGEEANQLRDRGLVALRLGRQNEAQRDLQRYIQLSPQASDLAKVQQILVHLKMNV